MRALRIVIRTRVQDERAERKLIDALNETCQDDATEIEVEHVGDSNTRTDADVEDDLRATRDEPISEDDFLGNNR